MWVPPVFAVRNLGKGTCRAAGLAGAGWAPAQSLHAVSEHLLILSTLPRCGFHSIHVAVCLLALHGCASFQHECSSESDESCLGSGSLGIHAVQPPTIQ